MNLKIFIYSLIPPQTRNYYSRKRQFFTSFANCFFISVLHRILQRQRKQYMIYIEIRISRGRTSCLSKKASRRSSARPTYTEILESLMIRTEHLDSFPPHSENPVLIITLKISKKNQWQCFISSMTYKFLHTKASDFEEFYLKTIYFHPFKFSPSTQYNNDPTLVNTNSTKLTTISPIHTLISTTASDKSTIAVRYLN